MVAEPRKYKPVLLSCKAKVPLTLSILPLRWLFSHLVMPNYWDPMDCMARQAPPSMGFPRQEYWSGLPFLFPGALPDPGVAPMSPALAGGFLPRPPFIGVTLRLNLANGLESRPEQELLTTIPLYWVLVTAQPKGRNRHPWGLLPIGEPSHC